MPLSPFTNYALFRSCFKELFEKCFQLFSYFYFPSFIFAPLLSSISCISPPSFTHHFLSTISSLTSMPFIPLFHSFDYPPSFHRHGFHLRPPPPSSFRYFLSLTSHVFHLQPPPLSSISSLSSPHLHPPSFVYFLSFTPPSPLSSVYRTLRFAQQRWFYFRKTNCFLRQLVYEFNSNTCMTCTLFFLLAFSKANPALLRSHR